MPTMIQVVGTSGAGKTLALEAAVGRLRRRGLRVAVLKHSHHRVDVRGKDTDRLRRAGAELVVFGSDGCVLFSDWDPGGLAMVLPVDVVLIEGFRGRRFPGPRFVVRRPTEAPAVAARIDRLVRGRPDRGRLTAGRGRRLSGPLWELVGNVMERHGVRSIERTEPRKPRETRSRIRSRRAEERVGPN